MTPHVTWRGAAAIVSTGLVVAWLGMTGLAVAQSLADGVVPGWDILLTPPTSLEDLSFLPALAALLGIEIACHGWHSSALARLARGGTQSDRTDIFYMLGNMTGLATVLGIVFSFGAVLGAERMFGITDVLRFGHHLPVWAQVAVLYVIGDFGEYWVHRFMHSPLMWPLHAIHHAAEDMTTLSATRHHPLDGIVGQLPYLCAGAMLGFSPQAVFWAGMLTAVHTFLIHSSLTMPGWVERYLVVGNRLHTLHHSSDERHHDRNFGLLVVWDRLFGTYLMEDTAKVRTGVDDPRFDTGRPMRDIWDVAVIWMAGLRSGLARRLVLQQRGPAPGPAAAP